MSAFQDGSAFKDAVLRIVRRIPPGRVLSYGAVAAMAGSPGRPGGSGGR